jgi:hypothetical protein
MSFHENMFSILYINGGLVIAGLLVGAVLGVMYGYTSDDKRKRITITAFVGILVAVIGGGLYFYSLSNQTDTFNIFTIFYVIGFGILALIANKIHHKYYGWGIASIPLFGDEEVGRLIDKYGPGFIGLDVTILEAMNKGNKNSKKISIYCNKSEKEIKKRMKFLEEKGVIKFE